MSNKQRPVAEMRLAACRAAIWANEASNGGTRFNVTLSRLYKDEAGNWRDSTSFGREDLPQLAEIVRQAWLWAFENGSQNGNVREAKAGGDEE